MKTIQALLESNREWAKELTAGDPQFFERLSEYQDPEFLWIGCSDSRISPIWSVGLLPGQMCVHRNVANLVHHSDMNCLAVVQFAVEVLRVKHIIICGHYNCGGVKAALDDSRLGLVDNWLRPIRDTLHKFQAKFDSLPEQQSRLDKLCELNVIEQIVNAGETTIVQDAWDRGQELSVHGWIYRIDEGIYRDLNVSVSSLAGLDEMRERRAETLPVGRVPV